MYLKETTTVLSKYWRPWSPEVCRCL